jgi:hypothetical protein
MVGINSHYYWSLCGPYYWLLIQWSLCGPCGVLLVGIGSPYWPDRPLVVLIVVIVVLV